MAAPKKGPSKSGQGRKKSGEGSALSEGAGQQMPQSDQGNTQGQQPGSQSATGDGRGNVSQEHTESGHGRGESNA